MPVYLAVAVGGALGSLSRYSLDRVLERRSFAVFPWSTFAINASGCLLIGIVIAAVVDRRHAPDWLRVGLVMGFVGGYTTFSTFAQESLDLIRVGHSGVAALYAVTSVAVGIIAASLGAAIGRLL